MVTTLLLVTLIAIGAGNLFFLVRKLQASAKEEAKPQAKKATQTEDAEISKYKVTTVTRSRGAPTKHPPAPRE
jgi:mannose/fructose/N-acetylgalactosamine-specific phosphotransferase system component IIC